jgi:hypothetical protein
VKKHTQPAEQQGRAADEVRGRYVVDVDACLKARDAIRMSAATAINKEFNPGEAR